MKRSLLMVLCLSVVSAFASIYDIDEFTAKDAGVPDDYIVAEFGGELKVAPADEVSSLQSGRLVVRQKFEDPFGESETSYQLYQGGKGDLSSMTPMTAEGVDYSKLVNAKLYTRRGAAADKDVEKVYFDGKAVYAPGLSTAVVYIDGKAVELHGVYSDNDIKLKYSFNGEHWMAVAGQYYWIDGKIKHVKEWQISDFFVNDEGDYFFKAGKIGDDLKKEIIVANGEIIRKDAYVGYFNLNAMQKLTFHFFSGGQCFVYEDGVITNKTEEYMSYFYEADRIDGMNIRIMTNNNHILEYVTGGTGLFIDGERVVLTKPYQVFYDSKHNFFRWNSIEPNDEGKIELVIYKYYL